MYMYYSLPSPTYDRCCTTITAYVTKVKIYGMGATRKLVRLLFTKKKQSKCSYVDQAIKQMKASERSLGKHQ